jgi:hypothetical protein
LKELELTLEGFGTGASRNWRYRWKDWVLALEGFGALAEGAWR